MRRFKRNRNTVRAKGSMPTPIDWERRWSPRQAHHVLVQMARSHPFRILAAELANGLVTSRRSTFVIFCTP